MTAPANDDFASAELLTDNGDGTFGASGTWVGSGTEPTEFDVAAGSPDAGASVRANYAHTVWYRWVVPDGIDTIDALFTVAGPTPNTLLLRWISTTGGTADTIDNIRLVDFVARDAAQTLQSLDGLGHVDPLIPGDVYYFQPIEMAPDEPDLTTFTLLLGPGLAPPPPPPPAQTAPLLTQTVNTAATMRVLEGIGFRPDRETAITAVRLVTGDRFSLQDSPILRNSSGPATSTERWIRLLFEPPFTRIMKLRFWSADYAPADSWRVLWGLAPDFQKPTRQLSSIALHELPTVDPAVAVLTLSDLIEGSASKVSEWLVIQAVCDGDAPSGPLQDPVPHLTFAWTEL